MQRLLAQAAMGPVDVNVNIMGGFAHVQLCSEPVNVMDMAMWEGLSAALKECEANPVVRGIIFSSGVKRDVFTAGNSLKELHAPSTTRERYFKFWHLSQVFAFQHLRPCVPMSAAHLPLAVCHESLRPGCIRYLRFDLQLHR